MRMKFDNAPIQVNCRICKSDFPNPILNGSSIVSVVCNSCRMKLCSANKKAAKSKSRVKVTKSASNVSLSSVPKSHIAVVAGTTPNSIKGWVS